MSMNSGLYALCDTTGCGACSDDYPELRGYRAYNSGKLLFELANRGWELNTRIPAHKGGDGIACYHFCPGCAKDRRAPSQSGKHL